MIEIHQIATMRTIGQPEDELVTVVCTCGWESRRTWSCDDSVDATFAEHLRTTWVVIRNGTDAYVRNARPVDGVRDAIPGSGSD